VINSFRRYVPVLIAFLAVCVLMGFGLTDQAYATDSIENEESDVGIEQEAGTSGGTVKRYIDISSAWSGAYIHENMTVEGKAEIKESFSMNNIKPGSNSSNNSDTGSVNSGNSGNPGSNTDSGNNTGTAENSSAEESNPNSGTNPEAGAGNESNSGNEHKPELETMELPGWSDLF